MDYEENYVRETEKIFTPHHRILVCALTRKYNKVWKKEKGKVFQAIKDTDGKVIKNYFKMVDTLYRFEVNEHGENDMFRMNDDPTGSQVFKCNRSLRKLIQNNPSRRFFLAYVISGAGQIMDGGQVLLLNELDKSAGWYKVFPVEKQMRNLA